MEDEVIIKSRRKGSDKWYFLIKPESDWWGSRRDLAMRFPERKAKIMVSAFNRKKPDFEIVIARIHGPASRS